MFRNGFANETRESLKTLLLLVCVGKWSQTRHNGNEYMDMMFFTVTNGPCHSASNWVPPTTGTIDTYVSKYGLWFNSGWVRSAQQKRREKKHAWTTQPTRQTAEQWIVVDDIPWEMQPEACFLPSLKTSQSFDHWHNRFVWQQHSKPYAVHVPNKKIEKNLYCCVVGYAIMYTPNKSNIKRSPLKLKRNQSPSGKHTSLSPVLTHGRSNTSPIFVWDPMSTFCSAYSSSDGGLSFVGTKQDTSFRNSPVTAPWNRRPPTRIPNETWIRQTTVFRCLVNLEAVLQGFDLQGWDPFNHLEAFLNERNVLLGQRNTKPNNKKCGIVKILWGVLPKYYLWFGVHIRDTKHTGLFRNTCWKKPYKGAVTHDAKTTVKLFEWWAPSALKAVCTSSEPAKFTTNQNRLLCPQTTLTPDDKVSFSHAAGSVYWSQSMF